MPSIASKLCVRLWLEDGGHGCCCGAYFVEHGLGQNLLFEDSTQDGPPRPCTPSQDYISHHLVIEPHLPSSMAASYQNNNRTDQDDLIQASSLSTHAQPSPTTLGPSRGSLIKLFFENKSKDSSSPNVKCSNGSTAEGGHCLSPSSSGQTSSSMSFTSQSQESDEASGTNSPLAATNQLLRTFAISQQQQQSYQDRQRQNNNQAAAVLSPQGNQDDDEFDGENFFEEQGRGGTLVPPKFRRLKQASPIKEEDDEDEMSDSSRADVSMTSACEGDLGPLSFARHQQNQQQQQFATLKAGAPHSFSTTSRGMSTAAPSRFFPGLSGRSNPVVDQAQQIGGAGVHRSSLDSDYALNCAWKEDESQNSQSSDFAESIYRPTPHDWLKRTYALSTAKGYKSSYNRANNSTMTSTRTASTQVPVYIQDKEVQTQTSAAYKLTQFVVKEPPTTRWDMNRPVRLEESASRAGCCTMGYAPQSNPPGCSAFYDVQPRKVIYPSSSSQAGSKVNPVQSRPDLSNRSGRRGGAARPKSLDDFENLSKSSFSHIRDWDSLNVLLPDEFKALMERIQARGQSNVQPTPLYSVQENQNKIQQQPQHQDDGLAHHVENNGVKLRYARRRMVRDTSLNSLADKAATSGLCGCGGADSRTSRQSKRFSLQEPFGANGEFISNRSQEQRGKLCLTRSETMPCCRPNHCQQMPWPQQMPPSCQYQSYKCYHQAQQPQGCCHPPCMSPGASAPTRPDPTIDQLCELLSMDKTLEEVASLLNKTASLSPLKSPSQTRDPVTTFHDSNFKVLKQHWEALADSLNQKDQITSQASTMTGLSGSISDASRRPGSSIDCDKSQVQQGTRRPQTTDKSSVILRRSVRDTPKAAKRPVSLNSSNFKSMIPVATGTKTPPASKLSSPVTNSSSRHCI